MSLGYARVKNQGDDVATDPDRLPTRVGPNRFVKTVPYRVLVSNRSLSDDGKAVRVRVPELEEPFSSNREFCKEFIGSIGPRSGSNIMATGIPHDNRIRS